MDKHFVVLVDNCSANQRDQVTAALKRHGVGWWHWFEYAWLVHTNGSLTEVDIRELVKVALANGRQLLARAHSKPKVLVLKVDPKGWAGHTPPNWTEWLRSNWTRANDTNEL